MATNKSFNRIKLFLKNDLSSIKLKVNCYYEFSNGHFKRARTCRLPMQTDYNVIILDGNCKEIKPKPELQIDASSYQDIGLHIQKMINYNKDYEQYKNPKYKLFSQFYSVRNMFDKDTPTRKVINIFGKILNKKIIISSAGNPAIVFNVEFENYNFNVIQWNIESYQEKLFESIDMKNQIVLFCNVHFNRIQGKKPNEWYFQMSDDFNSFIINCFSNNLLNIIQNGIHPNIENPHDIIYLWSNEDSIRENQYFYSDINIPSFSTLEKCKKHINGDKNKTAYFILPTSAIQTVEIDLFTVKHKCFQHDKVTDIIDCEEGNKWFEGNILLTFKLQHENYIESVRFYENPIKQMMKDLIENPILVNDGEWVNWKPIYKMIIKSNKSLSDIDDQSECNQYIYVLEKYAELMKNNKNCYWRFKITCWKSRNKANYNITLDSIHARKIKNNKKRPFPVHDNVEILQKPNKIQKIQP